MRRPVAGPVTRRAALGGAIALAGLGPARAAAGSFRRGIGVHSLMNWGALEPSRPDLYTFRPFSGPDYDLPDALLKEVATAGFDFYRLTLDPGPFLQLTGPARDALDAHLVATVRWLLRHGIGVMVDLHGNTQVPAYDPQKIIASADSPLFKSYVALVRRTAKVLAGLGRKPIAFELMNEPPYGYDPESRARWQGMIQTLHAAARAEAPDMLLVLTGSHGGDREGLADLDPAPFKGSRVLYSFHYYEPYEFTHQGVSDGDSVAPVRQYLSGMPYPANRTPKPVIEARVTTNIESDRSLSASKRVLVKRRADSVIDAYVRDGFDRATITRHFQGVSDWAAKHGLRGDQILLGEFGACRSYDNHRAADAASYEAWISDIRKEAEARGFGWAIWALTGTGGMALNATDGGDSLDPGSLCALGLKCR